MSSLISPFVSQVFSRSHVKMES